MPMSTSAKNLLLEEFATQAGYVSAHTGNPGDTGASEASGGSYARAAIAWNAASGGALDSSSAPDLDIPSGTTVTHIGFWTASTSGTFLGYITITSETFGSDGTLTVTDADWDLNA